MRAELKTDAGGFQHTAADDVFQRIVTEEGQVAGTAAGGDAGLHGNAAAADAALGEGVEIGGAGRFKFGGTAGFHRQAAEAVGNEEDNFGIVFLMQRAGELVHVEIVIGHRDTNFFEICRGRPRGYDTVGEISSISPRCSMTKAAQDLLNAFMALPPAEQQEVTVAILRQTAPQADLSESAFDEIAAELFCVYDAEEASGDKPAAQ